MITGGKVGPMSEENYEFDSMRENTLISLVRNAVSAKGRCEESGSCTYSELESIVGAVGELSDNTLWVMMGDLDSYCECDCAMDSNLIALRNAISLEQKKRTSEIKNQTNERSYVEMLIEKKDELKQDETYSDMNCSCEMKGEGNLSYSIAEGLLAEILSDGRVIELEEGSFVVLMATLVGEYSKNNGCDMLDICAEMIDLCSDEGGAC